MIPSPEASYDVSTHPAGNDGDPSRSSGPSLLFVVPWVSSGCHYDIVHDHCGYYVTVNHDHWLLPRFLFIASGPKLRDVVAAVWVAFIEAQLLPLQSLILYFEITLHS